VVASDKLFFSLFQERSERLQTLVASLLPELKGYSFSALAIKEREVRLDGLFLPPAERLHDRLAINPGSPDGCRSRVSASPLQRKRPASAAPTPSGPAPAPLARAGDLSLTGIEFR